jgi:hypothetical protein
MFLLGKMTIKPGTGAAPAILAHLNSAVLSLMDLVGVHKVPRQARYFDANPNQVVLALFSGNCSVY